MASFEQATQWMIEGKKVFREKSWYMFLDNDEIKLERPKNIYKDLSCSQNIDKNDLESMKWEIYEEEDNWNILQFKTEWSDRDENGNIYGFSVDVTYLKTLKEKILGDIKKELNYASVRECNLDFKIQQILNKRIGL